MDKFEVSNIIDAISCQYKVIGNPIGKYFSNLKPILKADKNSLVFIASTQDNKKILAKKTRSLIIICDDPKIVSRNLSNDKCFIIVQNPKLAFLRVANKYFKKKVKFGIHPTALIHPEAKIHKDVFIGPNAYVGKCQIH